MVQPSRDPREGKNRMKQPITLEDIWGKAVEGLVSGISHNFSTEADSSLVAVIVQALSPV